MTILITLHLSFLKVLSCRSSIISGLRKHRWQWSQSQRLSRELLYILVLFQINCLGSRVGTWTVQPNAKGQVGERNGDSFHCKWQQLEKPEITLSHRCWGEIWLGLGWEKDTYWSKRKNKQEPWEKEDAGQQIQPVTHCTKNRNWCGCFLYQMLWVNYKKGSLASPCVLHSPQSPRGMLPVLFETCLIANSFSFLIPLLSHQTASCLLSLNLTVPLGTRIIGNYLLPNHQKLVWYARQSLKVVGNVHK